MTLFRDEVMWIQQLFFGVGYSLGSKFGVPLYEYGGFCLPFSVVGVFSTLVSIGLIFTLPNPAQAEPAQAELGQAVPDQVESAQAKLR